MNWLQLPANRKRGVHARRRARFWANFKEIFWPSMGWRARLKLVILKLGKSAANPHGVALGAAIGMWVNFLPIPGLSVVISIALAWMLRANLAAAFVAQMLGNPWTFAPIWWLCYKTGKAVLKTPADAVGFKQVMANFNVSYFSEHAVELMHGVLWPMVVGGQLWGLGLGAVVYWLVLWEMRRLWERRRLARRAGGLRG